MSITPASIVKLAGSGVKAAGQIFQSQNEAQALGYNAFLNKQKARAIEIERDITKDKLERQNRKVLARQKALTAGSGRGFFGSPLAIMLDSEDQSEIDRKIVDYNSSLQIGQEYANRRLNLSSARSTRLLGFGQSVKTIEDAVTDLVRSNGLFGFGQSTKTKGDL